MPGHVVGRFEKAADSACLVFSLILSVVFMDCADNLGGYDIGSMTANEPGSTTLCTYDIQQQLAQHKSVGRRLQSRRSLLKAVTART